MSTGTSTRLNELRNYCEYLSKSLGETKDNCYEIFLLSVIDKLKAALIFELDCGDNSCRFTTSTGGMKTNGGCRCLRNNSHEATKILLKARQTLREVFGDT